MTNKVKLRVLAVLMFIAGAMLLVWGVPRSVKEYRRVNRCTAEVMAVPSKTDAIEYHGTRPDTKTAKVVYVYEYEGKEYKRSKVYRYPDATPVEQELELLIDPAEPASSTEKNDKNKDVKNAGALTGGILLVAAFIVNGISLHADNKRF